jgi:hypothetical protein
VDVAALARSTGTSSRWLQIPAKSVEAHPFIRS